MKNKSILLSFAFLSISSFSFGNVTIKSITEQLKGEPNGELVLQIFNNLTIEPLEDRLKIARIHADPKLSEEEKNKAILATDPGANLAQITQQAFKNMEEKIKRERMHDDLMAGIIIGLFVAIGFLIRHYK